MSRGRDPDLIDADIENAVSVKNHEQYTAQSAGVQFGLLPERQADIREIAAQVHGQPVKPAKLHPWRRGPSCSTNKALRSYKKIKRDRETTDA